MQRLLYRKLHFEGKETRTDILNFFSNTGIVMILEIFSFECYFPRDLLSDFEIQMRIRQRRST